MKKILFLAVITFFTLAISGCGKDLGNNSNISSNSSGSGSGSSGGGSSYQSDRATLILNNISSNPYKFYFDGDYQTTISGHSSKSYNVRTGYHVIRVVQSSGYTFYATDETYTFTAVAGGTYYCTFPEDSWGKSQQE